MANWEATQVLLASSARGSSGVDVAVDLGTRDRLLRQTLTVGSPTGSSPVLTVRFEASADGVTSWQTFATFTKVTSASTEKTAAIAPDRFVRVAWTITGTTPSFTFGVTGTRGITFANLDHLEGLGIPAAALATVSTSKKAEQLAATTELASGILAGRYDLPIVAWGIDLSMAVAKIAAYELLSVRGFNPDGEDTNVRKRCEDAMRWLADVASGKISPVGLVDSTPDEQDTGGIEVCTLAARGWR